MLLLLATTTSAVYAEKANVDIHSDHEHISHELESSGIGTFNIGFFYSSLVDVIEDEVPCQGLYHRKYEMLHNDGNVDEMSAKKLWADNRMLKRYVTHSSGEEVNIMCKCCTTYTEWKKRHQDASKVLQCIADMPCHYKNCYN